MGLLSESGDPVAQLREASRLMRERATLATAGPWEVPPDCPGEITHGYRKDGSRHVATWIATIDVSDESIPEAESDANAEHIASWYPLVALAVADWLDAEADHAGQSGWALHALSPGPLAVARAYLSKGGDDE